MAHTEPRPGMGCGDEDCKEHYPLAKPFPPADGMARLQHDVVTLPADQQALGLVEAMERRLAKLLAEAATMQGDLERLKVLLEKQS